MTRGLFVATPMYGGQCYGAYTHSMMQLALLAGKRGLELRYFPIFNESHIDRGRNICVDEFLQSGLSHMMFIDADLQFKPEDVLSLVSIADPEGDKDMVGGFYPKKTIAWAKIVAAVKAGFADKDPNVLEHFVGDMVFTPALNNDSYRSRSINELVEVHELGTGFMLIQRRVFERVEKLNRELVYRKTGPNSDTITCFFDAKIDPEEHPYKRFLTEDYDFCRLVRNAGMKIWLAPWIKLTHYGTYRFIGDIEALAAVEMKAREAA